MISHVQDGHSYEETLQRLLSWNKGSEDLYIAVSKRCKEGEERFFL